MTIIVTSFGSF